jgi:hypothetical protein
LQVEVTTVVGRFEMCTVRLQRVEGQTMAEYTVVLAVSAIGTFVALACCTALSTAPLSKTIADI